MSCHCKCRCDLHIKQEADKKCIDDIVKYDHLPGVVIIRETDKLKVSGRLYCD